MPSHVMIQIVACSLIVEGPELLDPIWVSNVYKYINCTSCHDDSLHTITWQSHHHVNHMILIMSTTSSSSGKHILAVRLLH